MKENQCPNCQKLCNQSDENNYRPFCSKKCQQADLYQWFWEENRLSREITEDDMQNPAFAKEIEDWQNQCGTVDPYDPLNF